MRRYQTLLSFTSFLLVPVAFLLLLELSTEAQNCCTPPPRPAEVPRYPQNTNVTVYIDTTGLNTPAGFSDLEKQAIKEGIQNWNSQTNNSGVTFTVQETTNPPTLPAQAHVAVVQYQNQQNPNAIAGTQTLSSGPFVSNKIVFFQNIRNVFNIAQNQPPFVRSVARHETGHTIGLGNADDCNPGTTIMRLASGGETFITACDNNAVASQNSVYPSPTPTPEPEPCTPTQGQLDWCRYHGGWWDYGPPACQCEDWYSPIVIDVLGDGFALTNATSGVMFDLDGDGVTQRLAWTAIGSDDVWLALDRNGNGTIDDGTELFGNLTPQPAPVSAIGRNGFLALAEYDKTSNGGSADGVITNADTVFSALRLWQDVNHNGISEASELKTLPALGLATLELDHKTSNRTDEFGNQFRYRAKVKDGNGSQLGRWAWDVFLKSAP